MAAEAVEFPTQASLVMCAVSLHLIVRAFNELEDLTIVSGSFRRKLSVVELSPIVSFCHLKQVDWVV